MSLTPNNVFEGASTATADCRLVTFVPFSINDDDDTEPSPSSTESNEELFHQHAMSLSYLASAMMALEHFNERDSSIVPELANLNNCSAKFDLGSSVFLNAGRRGRKSTRILRDMLSEAPVCAIAGPCRNIPAHDVSMLASMAQVPVVIHESTNIDLTKQSKYPYTSQVYPSLPDSAFALVSWLQYKGRSDHIAILYSLSSDDSWQLQQYATTMLDYLNIRSRSFGYRLHSSRTIEYLDEQVMRGLPQDNLNEAVAKVKESGYRTVLVLADDAFSDDDFIPRLADEAALNGLTDGDHLWAFTSTPSNALDKKSQFLSIGQSASASNITKLLSGSAVVVPMDDHSTLGNDAHRKSDFRKSWDAQTSIFADKVLSEHKFLSSLASGPSQQTSNFFKTLEPAPGSGFMYDTVMSVGFGMCNAEAAKNEKNKTQSDFHDPLLLLQGIRSASFTGPSGKASFEQTDPHSPGSRSKDSIVYGVWNLLPAQSNSTGVLSDILPIGSTRYSDWKPVNDFYFADGRTVPPNLLRDTPEQNHLLPSARLFGYTLFAISSILILGSAAWTIKFREHSVVKAAQPALLLLICFGSFVASLAIIMMSLDESSGLSDAELGKACTSLPWLAALGVIFIYGGLYTKLKRIDEVLKFSKATIKISHVAWPLRAMFGIAVVLLTFWTIYTPFKWDRKEIDEISGESIGRCSDINGGGPWLTPVVITEVVAILLTFFMSWKTKDVDAAFSEATWIFSMIFVQLQTLVVGVPLAYILIDVSPNGAYIGFALLIWTIPMTTIVMIFSPKLIAFFYSSRPAGVHALPPSGSFLRGSGASLRGSGASLRGSGAGVRVSGLDLQVSSKRSAPGSSLRSSTERTILTSDPDPLVL